MNYYVNICIKENLTRDNLKERIQSNEYELI